MAPIISLLVIATVSLLIVRYGATALMMTGLSWDIASFQAYSAFFGVGFTTRESEMVVNHPVRRRIVRHLILAGNLGLTAAFGSLIVAFVKADGTHEEMGVLLWILAGLVSLWLLSITPPVRAVVDRLIKLSLRRSGVLHAMDFALLLRVQSGFCISEYEIGAASPLIGRTLAQNRMAERGVMVLGITRADSAGHETYLGTPTGKTPIQPGDVLTVYGKESDFKAVLA